MISFFYMIPEIRLNTNFLYLYLVKHPFNHETNSPSAKIRKFLD